MFGYVRTDIPNLYIKDSVLYRAMYCGLCKSIGGKCGQCGRLALNYDLTFLSALFHNLTGTDVTIERKRCIMHWFIPREIVKRDEITDRIACLNIILAYHKFGDDIIDSGRGRGKRAFFKKAYKRAVKAEPKLDEITARNYKALLNYERSAGDSIDIAADFFGQMLKQLTEELLGEQYNETVGALGYNLGKWIYLIDALDDFDKDKKKNQYNPFVLSYPEIATREELVEKKESELSFIFGVVLQDIASQAKMLDYKFNHDLTDNILYKGLGLKTRQIMKSEKKSVKSKRDAF